MPVRSRERATQVPPPTWNAHGEVRGTTGRCDDYRPLGRSDVLFATICLPVLRLATVATRFCALVVLPVSLTAGARLMRVLAGSTRMSSLTPRAAEYFSSVEMRTSLPASRRLTCPCALRLGSVRHPWPYVVFLAHGPGFDAGARHPPAAETPAAPRRAQQCAALRTGHGSTPSQVQLARGSVSSRDRRSVRLILSGKSSPHSCVFRAQIASKRVTCFRLHQTLRVTPDLSRAHPYKQRRCGLDLLAVA